MRWPGWAPSCTPGCWCSPARRLIRSTYCPGTSSPPSSPISAGWASRLPERSCRSGAEHYQRDRGVDVPVVGPAVQRAVLDVGVASLQVDRAAVLELHRHHAADDEAEI